MTYQRPPQPIADLVNLKPDPLMLFGPDPDYIVIADRPMYPSIEELKEPKVKLAGRQINPDTFTPYGTRGFHHPRLRQLSTGEDHHFVGLPEEGSYRYFTWSPDGTQIAFCLVTEQGLQLWTANRHSLQCYAVGNDDINNSLGGVPYDFIGNDRFLVKRRIAGQEKPERTTSITGPTVQDSSGKEGANRTYTNLLENEYDVALFRYYAAGQLYMHRLDTGEETAWAEPGIIAGLGDSPSGEYFVITYVVEPFSYNVPYDKFADKVQLLDREGYVVRELTERPTVEHLPPAFGAVITQPRRYSWRSDHPAQLYWTEALDGGDPRTPADYREQLYYLEAPFTGDPQPSIQLPLRFGALRWGRGDLAIAIDWEWATRRQVTRRWYPDDPSREPEVLFDHNWEDNYNDPGSVITTSLPSDHSVLLTRDDGQTLIMVGNGHSPDGPRPFVEALSLVTKARTRLWESTPPYFERPMFFLDQDPDYFLLAREQSNERPNFFLRHLTTGAEIRVTNFPHPYPQLQHTQYELLTYAREDGVQLSGELHTPEGFRAGVDAPLPILMWAYPQEYKDADKAGQVTSSAHQFRRISPLSPLPFLAAGYAVFDDFAMPIVGEGEEEPNETFIEQVRMNAEAAVRKLVDAGVADADRIYVGGHSYGAFMTAHLLAHTDLFAGGIARSGAFNRTLTPFGFQAEERTFWQVPDTYVRLSPFVHADKINSPLLLIHGEDDSNSGTYPVQSKRMFTALDNLGKTARLCLLPYEDHSYAAEESILHMLWEMHRWMERCRSPLLLFLTLVLTSCRTAVETILPEVAKWQEMTLTFPGPMTGEQAEVNPFTDYRLDITFTNGDHQLTVPAFYAADGRAGYTGATQGSTWQVRFRPDREGEWNYTGELVMGKNAYLGGDAGATNVVERYSGGFYAGPAKAGETGRLIRDHPRYLRWAESGDYFIKSGVNSPENLLAYADFDGTYRHSDDFRDGESRAEGLHEYAAHLPDYRTGDPAWNGKGKGLIGGINYLHGAGVNSIYFLTMNINGDGKDVWPYASHDDFSRFDVSKLEQWEIVFDHADSLGMMLHFVLNETENETLLDGGDTGPQRQLYFRELVARFGHHRAVTWNLGEENGPNNWSETAQDNDQQRAVIEWFADNDPYQNYVVLHTHPGEEAFAEIYRPLLGAEDLDGLSLQLGWPWNTNEVTVEWLDLSAEAGAPWIITLDEIGPWWRGLDPDDVVPNNQDSLRALALWGNLLAGGAGAEWYYGARSPNNDLNLEDWRTRERAYRWTAHAREFFHAHLPFWDMHAHNELTAGEQQFCFAQPGEVYAVATPFGQPAKLDLSGAQGEFTVRWYDPREGGELIDKGERVLASDGVVRLVPPGEGDWVALVEQR